MNRDILYFKGNKYDIGGGKINKSSKINYCYLVYCNVEPIVYGVYKKRKDAIKYALSLIKFRKERALDKKYSFGFYHYYNRKNDEKKARQIGKKVYSQNEFDKYHHRNEFSCCLMIKDDKSQFSDDRCLVKIERYLING